MKSRFGVSPRLEPKKPMRSARVVSRVMRIMLTGLAKLASELPARKSRHTNDRHKNIQPPPSIFLHLPEGNFTLAGLSRPELPGLTPPLAKGARSSGKWVTI